MAGTYLDDENPAGGHSLPVAQRRAGVRNTFLHFVRSRDTGSLGSRAYGVGLCRGCAEPETGSDQCRDEETTKENHETHNVTLQASLLLSLSTTVFARGCDRTDTSFL